MVYNNIINKHTDDKRREIFAMSKSDNINVKMVITEEKILANIEKVQKMINPHSKKQIIKLEENSYFRDLIESIKTYLMEYPEKDNFPKNVYDAAFQLVEFATSQFEENTKLIEDLIRKREYNISLGVQLKETLQAVQNKESGWKKKVDELPEDFSEEIIDTLGQLGRLKNNKSQNYLDALKTINAKIDNLESNLHLEIDMGRIEDKSKALSYIGIEIAEALREIPISQNEETPEISNNNEQQVIPEDSTEDIQYIEDTHIDVKPSLWDRIKNMKLIRGLRYMMKIKIVLELPSALPEGKNEEHYH